VISPFEFLLSKKQRFFVRQHPELFELLGVETRNKYEIMSEDKEPLGFAAEQGSGFTSMCGRAFLGHWRDFEIHFFDSQRLPMLRAHHPFSFYFGRLEIYNQFGEPLGTIQKRFSLFSRKLDVLDAQGNLLCSTNAPIWTPWTFLFYDGEMALGAVRKQWSGLLKETFTDADNFMVEFSDRANLNVRILLLCSALLIDILYFERKAGD